MPKMLSLNPLQTPLVSVIIPVYNAEHALTLCLDTLKAQTYRQLEIIFIDDCSTDNSMHIIGNFATMLENESVHVKVLCHKQNKGVAFSRNTGLNHASGDYIYFLDADDTIESNTIELLLTEILNTDADIVGCNWHLTFAQNERRMKQPVFDTPWDAIQKMLSGVMRWNLWLFLVKRTLYTENNIHFIPGMNMGEDMMVMFKLFACANKVSYLDQYLYHYGQNNTSSLTKTYSPSHIKEVTKNVNEVENYLQGIFADKVSSLMHFLKLNIKLPLLISANTDNYKLWLNWFPESNSYILKNNNIALHTKVLQWMASHQQFWAIKIYYYLIIRLIYGVIYR